MIAVGVLALTVHVRIQGELLSHANLGTQIMFGYEDLVSCSGEAMVDFA